MTYQFKIILGLLLGSVLVSCGIFKSIDETLPDHRADYKKSKSVEPLEVPPDLLAGDMEETLTIPEATTQPQMGTLSTDDNKTVRLSEGVLPTATQMQIKRVGDIRWLAVNNDVNVVWKKVRAFWREEGFELTQDDPKIGVIETDWKENRADIPKTGIRKLIGSVLDGVYSSSTRDKFRTRLERGQEANTTAIYLTHRGAEEVSQRDNFAWQVRPADPELEAEMLRRLMIFMGLEKRQADTVLAAEQKPVSRATLQRDKSDQPYLMVQEDFERAWQRTGLALDRLGFTVEDRNRAQGIYLILYLDPEQNIGEGKGFWASVFGNNEETEQQQYAISLLDAQENTYLSVKNKAGQVDKTSEQILTLLQTQLK
jgi:outer membrane protein assembly factor BamC